VCGPDDARHADVRPTNVCPALSTYVWAARARIHRATADDGVSESNDGATVPQLRSVSLQHGTGLQPVLRAGTRASADFGRRGAHAAAPTDHRKRARQSERGLSVFAAVHDRAAWRRQLGRPRAVLAL